MLKETEIKKNVFAKIRTGEISMRPRIYFVARVIALVLLSIVAFMLAMFVLSFAFFSIHESGEQFLLGFGQRGLFTFITLFPWLPFVIAVALIVLLDYLLRYFKFGYRISILEIFLIALVIVTMAGIGITFTPLHSTLLNDADHDELPLLGPLYEQIYDSHQEQGVYRGTVTSIEGNDIVITHNDDDHDADDGTRDIILPVGDSPSTLSIGDRIYVFGTATGTMIQAYGIEPLSPDQ